MNVSKALQVLGMAVLYPDTHNQSNWVEVPASQESVTAEQMRTNPSSCGTTLCYAGFAAAMFAPANAFFSVADEESFFVPAVDGKYVIVHEWDAWEEENRLVVNEYDPDDYCCSDCQPRFDQIDIMEFAQDILELEPAQASYLFAGNNSVERMKNLIRYLMTNPHADTYELREEFGECW